MLSLFVILVSIGIIRCALKSTLRKHKEVWDDHIKVYSLTLQSNPQNEQTFTISSEKTFQEETNFGRQGVFFVKISNDCDIEIANWRVLYSLSRVFSFARVGIFYIWSIWFRQIALLKENSNAKCEIAGLHFEKGTSKHLFKCLSRSLWCTKVYFLYKDVSKKPNYIIA